MWCLRRGGEKTIAAKVNDVPKWVVFYLEGKGPRFGVQW